MILDYSRVKRMRLGKPLGGEKMTTLNDMNSIKISLYLDLARIMHNMLYSYVIWLALAYLINNSGKMARLPSQLAKKTALRGWIKLREFI